MNALPILTAYKDGKLAQMIQQKADAYLATWPSWNEAAAIAIAAAYYGKLAQQENANLTMEARRASPAADDLYWWLKEDAPCSAIGYIADISGSRSLLMDMEQFDQIMAELEARDWSAVSNESRLLAPTRAAIREYHGDLLR